MASGLVTRSLRRKETRKAGSKAGQAGKGRKVEAGRSTRSSKGKGRRTIFKQKPVRSLSTPATITTSGKVYYKVCPAF